MDWDCVADIFQHDASGTVITDFSGCGDLDELTITGLKSATFSGTISNDDGTQQVTITADLTGIREVVTSPFQEQLVTPTSKIIEHSIGTIRSATGSLDISGDITYSTDIDGGSGFIGTSRGGTIELQKL